MQSFSTITAMMKYSAASPHSHIYGSDASSSVPAFEFIPIKPCMPHEAGTIDDTACHSGDIALRGHVSPERNRNITDVNTNTRNELSRSLTSGLSIIPRKAEANRNGNANGRYCHGEPNIGRWNISGT